MWKWLKDWRRRNFRTAQESYNDGYLFGISEAVRASKIENSEEKDAAINALFDRTYGNIDAFDRGMRDGLYETLYKL